MARRLRDAALLPVQLSVLVLLHVLFALYRLVCVARQLPATVRVRVRLATTRPAEDGVERLRLDIARGRWHKSPKHLAVVFVPSRLKWARRTEQVELAKLERDLVRVLRWAELLAVESVSVYDEAGILDRNAETVTAHLAAAFPLLSPRKPTQDHLGGSTIFRIAQPRIVLIRDEDGPGREVDSGCGASERDESPGTFSASASTLVATPAPSCLTVTLLSRLSGRPHLARVAQQLAERLHRESHNTLPEGAVEEVVEAAGLAEPDLLLVLGGPYLRLHGFPPWQVRLTEIHHHPSPSWLPPPMLAYPVFRKALDLYGHAEKRLGR